MQLTPHAYDVKRQQLSELLFTMLVEARMTGGQAAGHAGHTQSWWAKVVSGYLRPSTRDIRAILANAPRVGVDTRRRILSITDVLDEAAYEARRLVVQRPGSRMWTLALVWEREAVCMHEGSAHVIPELLRTDAYHMCLLGDVPDYERDDYLEVLRKRQGILGNTKRTHRFLLHEPALRRSVGAAASTMQDQVDHLISLESRPNIHIGLVPWDVPVPPGHPLSFRMVQSRDRRIVVIDLLPTGRIVLDNDREVREYERDFLAMQRVALVGDELIRYLRHLRNLFV